MFAFLRRHKSILTLVLLVTFSLVLSWLTVDPANPVGEISFLKHQSAVMLIPVYSCCSIISTAVYKTAYFGSVFTSIFQRPADKAKIEILQSKIADLERQLAAEKARNRRIEELYKVRSRIMRKNPSIELIPAKVIAVDPAEWFRYITIDRGGKHGIRIDMPVITGSYLDTNALYLTGAIVGRISDVYPNSAKIQLITDRMSTVAVTIEPLGDLVLMRGKPENEGCGIDEIPSTAYDSLTVGDVVTVDERSDIFPPGMLVGRISKIKREIEFCPIEVKPSFDFRKLKEVMVVMDAGY